MKSILFLLLFLGLLSVSSACSAQTQTKNSDTPIEVIDYNSSAGEPSEFPQQNTEGTRLSTDKNALKELKELCLKSKANWQKIKHEDNAYSYKNIRTSSGGSFTLAKEVTFLGNDALSLIIHRDYRTDEATQTELNVRTQKRSYELKGIRSIDEIYEYCLETLFSMSEQEYTIYFGTDENGIINLYGFSPKNCADDCFEGQYIKEFSWQ